MSLEQPATQHNYTEIGFKKMRAPDEILLTSEGVLREPQG